MLEPGLPATTASLNAGSWFGMPPQTRPRRNPANTAAERRPGPDHRGRPHHPVPGGMLETAENLRRRYGMLRLRSWVVVGVLPEEMGSGRCRPQRRRSSARGSAGPIST